MKKIDIQPYLGQHCETTTTGTLLKQLNIHLSEPMLFGLGEGLGFIYWNMKRMDFPFIGGRIKTDHLTANICNNLDLKLDIQETSSIKKAWNQAKMHIDNGQVVGLKLDCYHLEYFTNKIHFAGHYAALIGYDEHDAYLVDTAQQGGVVRTSLESLALARNEKGPMSSRNLNFTISGKADLNKLSTILRGCIERNAIAMLNPPIKNFGCKGMDKASVKILEWYHQSKDPAHDFATLGMIMERAGTGGALFRNLYRDFLLEASEICDSKLYYKMYQHYIEIAKLWSEVSSRFEMMNQDPKLTLIEESAHILKQLSRMEEECLRLII